MKYVLIQDSFRIGKVTIMPKNTNNSKYQKCYNAILKYIDTQKLAAGDKLPTEQQIMDMLQVSRITVRRALAELEQKGLVSRVQGSGSFVQKKAESPVGMDAYIPLVLPGDMREPTFLTIIRGAEDYLEKHSLWLTTHFAHGDEENERKVITQLAASGAKCIMIYPTHGTGNEKFFRKMQEKEIEFVFLDRISPFISGNLVQCDNVTGGYEATSHLLKQGYRRICFFCPTPITEASSLEQRLDGYRIALKEHEIPWREEYVVCVSGGQEEEACFEQLQSLPEPPDAYFCANDFTAVFILRCLEKRNIPVPDKVGVIGFDNCGALQHFPFTVSTMQQPYYEIGYEAAKLTCDIFEGNLSGYVHKIIPVKLIEGDSTRHNAAQEEN